MFVVRVIGHQRAVAATTALFLAELEKKFTILAAQQSVVKVLRRSNAAGLPTTGC